MKRIEIDGRTFLYKIITIPYYLMDVGRNTHTVFYHSEPIKEIKRKYILFGKKVERSYFKNAFVLQGVDIESNKHSKEYIREMIEKEVQKVKRAEEIERGEII